MAVVATGGYGRGLMAPESDIDLLFILPYKQTAWGEQVAEAILYCLWDMGLKVGHATRSVDECDPPGARRHDDPHRDPRDALPDRRPAALRRTGRALRQGGRAGHRGRIRHRQARRARGAASPRRAVALSGRAQRQGRQGRPARPAHAVLDREIRLPRARDRRTASNAACSTRRNTAPSAAAPISCGRCAATCISSPAAPRSGCRSTCSARSRSGSAIPRIPACRMSNAS